MNQDKIREHHVISLETVNPDKLLPELLSFFARLIGAKQKFKMEEVSSEIILAAMTRAYATLLVENNLLPKAVLEHLEDIYEVGEVEANFTPHDDSIRH